MKVGFLTNAFTWAGETDLHRIADFACENGFSFLEMGPGLSLDPALLQEISRQIPIRAFIFCRNFLDDDPEVADAFRQELRMRMEIAASVGARRIICSTGISRKRSLPPQGGCDPLKSLEPAVDFLQEVTAFAETLGIQVCLENCPMYRNIATSPLMWREIFRRVPSPALGLCYDPGHFVWQMIDVYRPLSEFGNRIHHLHMKDTYVDHEMLSDIGILHNVGEDRGIRDHQWWRHTLPGDGEIDWNLFGSLLRTHVSPDADLSIEMEDPRYELDPSRVGEAMKIALTRLTRDYRIASL